MAADFFAVDFLAVDRLAADRFAVERFVAPVLAVDVLDDADLFAAVPRTLELCRFAAEATRFATFGAFFWIARPICGARLETSSPAARIALPTRGGVFEASFLAASGAFFRTVLAIFGARSATALPTAGAFCAMPPIRSPSLSTAPFDLFAMHEEYRDAVASRLGLRVKAPPIPGLDRLM